MSEPVINDVAGLQLSNNTFSASPPGSQLIADNIVISQKGVGQPRNGQQLAGLFADATKLPYQVTEFQQTVIASSASSKTSPYDLGALQTGFVTPYAGGPYNPVDANGVDASYARMKFCQAAQFLYFCTQNYGPMCLEVIGGTPRKAGLPRMPDSFAFAPFIASTPGNGWMPYNSSVAYRTVLKRATSTGVPNLSPPSNRVIITNRNLVPEQAITRASTTVTAVFNLSNPIAPTPLVVGKTFLLSPGEANFPAGEYTVLTSVIASGVLTVTWTQGSGSATSTLAQELMPSISGQSQPLAVELDVALPDAAAAGDFVQIYRSVPTDLSTISPSDELFQSGEVQLTSGDVSTGVIAINDYTPLGVPNNPLYTNPQTGQGATAINFAPPIYRDVASFDSQVWYLNTTGQQSFSMQMLGVGAANGVQDGDTITISDIAAGGTVNKTFTFKNTVGSATQMQIVSNGTPSYNINWTSQYLTEFTAAAITGTLVGTGIRIYQDSGPNDYPGKLIIERSDFGPQFTVQVSRPGSWSPGFGTAPLASDNNRQPNGLYNSKLAEPEAVPLVNFQTVGSKSYFGDRLLSLRMGLIICKEGDGIWALTGSNGNYTLQQISSANIIAPDCAAVFGDYAWVYTDQGIVRVSATGGVSVVSRPIETVLNTLAAMFPTSTYSDSFAVAYETERRIMFYVPVSGTDGVSVTMQAFCYSAATNAWTKFNAAALSGIVTADHHLWLGIYDTLFKAPRLTEERKTQTYLDIADGQFPMDVIAYPVNGDATLIQLNDPADSPVLVLSSLTQGFGLTQLGWATKIAAVRSDIGPGVFQLSEVAPWQTGVRAIQVYQPYPVEIQYLPAGSPASRQVLTRLAEFFKPGAFSNYFGVTTLETDQIQAELQIPTPFLGFGLTPFGTGPFGNPTPQVVDVNPIDPKWVNAAQYFIGFALNEVWCQFKLQGVYSLIERAAGPTGRGK